MTTNICPAIGGLRDISIHEPREHICHDRQGSWRMAATRLDEIVKTKLRVKPIVLTLLWGVDHPLNSPGNLHACWVGAQTRGKERNQGKVEEGTKGESRPKLPAMSTRRII